jgi:hypothetical protein
MKKHTFESCFFRCYLGQHEEREGRGSCSSRGSLPLSLCLSLVNLGLESPVRIFLFLETSERLRGASAESAGPPLFPPEGASSLSPSLRICLSRREETRRLTCEAKQENRVEKKPLILLEKVFAEKAKKRLQEEGKNGKSKIRARRSNAAVLFSPPARPADLQAFTRNLPRG